MSVNAHIQQLQQRHAGLEDQLHDLKTSPSATDAERHEIKRKKLQLKDEISRLQSTA